MIRFIIAISIVVIYLIVGIPLMFITWVIGKWNPYLRDISRLRMVQAAFKLCLFVAGTDITYIGRENIPKDRAVLYVGNHRSYFDILLTYTQCPDLTGFIAKDQMLKYPLLRDWMRCLYCLFLNRDDIRAGMQVILTGIEYIKKGISIFVFPEGTRSKDGTMLPFKEGSMKMATKSGCPIIPVAITNSAAIWEHQFPKMKPCKVVVEYGAPIIPKELTKEEQKFLGAYTQQVIQNMLDQHQI